MKRSRSFNSFLGRKPRATSAAPTHASNQQRFPGTTENHPTSFNPYGDSSGFDTESSFEARGRRGAPASGAAVPDIHITTAETTGSDEDWNKNLSSGARRGRTISGKIGGGSGGNGGSGTVRSASVSPGGAAAERKSRPVSIVPSGLVPVTTVGSTAGYSPASSPGGKKGGRSPGSSPVIPPAIMTTAGPAIGISPSSTPPPPPPPSVGAVAAATAAEREYTPYIVPSTPQGAAAAPREKFLAIRQDDEEDAGFYSDGGVYSPGGTGGSWGRGGGSDSEVVRVGSLGEEEGRRLLGRSSKHKLRHQMMRHQIEESDWTLNVAGSAPHVLGRASSEAEAYEKMSRSVELSDGGISGAETFPRKHSGNASSPSPTPSRTVSVSGSTKGLEKVMHRLFGPYGLPPTERLHHVFMCATPRSRILQQGQMFVTENFVCFHSNIFGFQTSYVLHCADIVSVDPARTAMVIPNAVVVGTRDGEEYFFTSFVQREKALGAMRVVMGRGMGVEFSSGRWNGAVGGSGGGSSFFEKEGNGTSPRGSAVTLLESGRTTLSSDASVGGGAGGRRGRTRRAGASVGSKRFGAGGSDREHSPSFPHSSATGAGSSSEVSLDDGERTLFLGVQQGGVGGGPGKVVRRKSGGSNRKERSPSAHPPPLVPLSTGSSKVERMMSTSSRGSSAGQQSLYQQQQQQQGLLGSFWSVLGDAAGAGDGLIGGLAGAVEGWVGWISPASPLSPPPPGGAEVTGATVASPPSSPLSGTAPHLPSAVHPSHLHHPIHHHHIHRRRSPAPGTIYGGVLSRASNGSLDRVQAPVAQVVLTHPPPVRSRKGESFGAAILGCVVLMCLVMMVGNLVVVWRVGGVVRVLEELAGNLGVSRAPTITRLSLVIERFPDDADK
ncbi:hypothetical protein HDU97_005344 [Phlyctochytrium planicorne]|nr:hypothetical protein HDU97_005344 [Phlyctochytrium planicorne]